MTEQSEQSRANDRCGGRRGYRVYGASTRYVQCEQCDQTFADADNVEYLPTHTRMGLFPFSSSSEDRDAVRRASWSLDRMTDGRFVATDPHGSLWDAPEIGTLVAWIDRAMTTGDIGTEPGSALIRQAVRLTTIR